MNLYRIVISALEVIQVKKIIVILAIILGLNNQAQACSANWECQCISGQPTCIKQQYNSFGSCYCVTNNNNPTIPVFQGASNLSNVPTNSGLQFPDKGAAYARGAATAQQQQRTPSKAESVLNFLNTIVDSANTQPANKYPYASRMKQELGESVQKQKCIETAHQPMSDIFKRLDAAGIGTTENKNFAVGFQADCVNLGY